MSRTRFDEMSCGVARALDQLGDWWTLLIVRDAMLGATRFQQFESNLGIAKNILSDRLAKLVRHGVLTRERLDEPGQRYAYVLTPKGRDLWIVLTALRLWADEWIFGEDAVPARFEERGTGRAVARLVAVGEDGKPVDASRLEWVPGPGWPASVQPSRSAPWENAAPASPARGRAPKRTKPRR